MEKENQTEIVEGIYTFLTFELHILHSQNQVKSHLPMSNQLFITDFITNILVSTGPCLSL